METAPAAAANAAPAAPPPGASSAEHTPQAQASPSPQVTVSATGNPGTVDPKPQAGGKWTDSFDADAQEYVRQKGFQDQKALLDSYRNLEKLRGVPQDRLLKLPEAGDEKGWKDVYEKLGKPATPEGYGLQAKDPNNTGFVDWAKSTFDKLNLTTQQGQELVAQFNTFSEAQEKAANEQHTAAVQGQVLSLKKEWGAAFDQNVGAAQAAYRRMGIPDKAIDALERTMGFDGVIKMFHGIGAKIGEHAFIDGGGQGKGAGFGDLILAPAEAAAKIKALKADPGFAAKYIARDANAVAEMERLHKMAYPTD